VRILLTGGSSFTGLWFARSFVATGHTVVATLKEKTSYYSGLRGERVAALQRVAEVVEGCTFGSTAFLDLASGDQPIATVAMSARHAQRFLGLPRRLSTLPSSQSAILFAAIS
jgi:nucleoside-diphosphate-sugar epimerase